MSARLPDAALTVREALSAVPGITNRPTSPSDRDQLRQIYASTRDDELALVEWPAGAKAAFLAQQSDAQDADYRARYPDGAFHLLQQGDEVIGRLYVAWLDPTELRIVDITLLPKHRRRGLGTALLNGVLSAAGPTDSIVSLHVEVWNPARELYGRLGFIETGATDVHIRLERRPRK